MAKCNIVMSLYIILMVEIEQFDVTTNHCDGIEYFDGSTVWIQHTLCLNVALF